MSSEGSGSCDHCGVWALMHEARVGIQRWACCQVCAHLLRDHRKGLPRPVHPFGRDTLSLPPTQQGMAGWATYRYACHHVGYTLSTAHDAVERDLLRLEWGRWDTYLLRVRREIGTVKDNKKSCFFLVPFLAHLDTAYGPIPEREDQHDAWLLAQCKETPDLLRAQLRGRFGPIPEPRGLLHGRPDTGHAAASVA